MGKTLYRKYRSKSLSEIVGQDHIVKVLSSSLKSGQMAHAYLLTGPRGVGKTSIARILAYEVNNQEYSSEGNNLDIIEIDAASNRRIDEIREIRDKINIAPSVGKYKIYIIDEAHMLTKEAFNALLKTLEEPPKHVIFILATTEFHKLPETIVSRCVRLTFKSISPELLQKHLLDITKKEKIIINEPAISLISKHAHGSFRDALSLLEQLKNLSSQITLDDVYEMLGLAKDEYIEKILKSVFAGDVIDLKSILTDTTLIAINEALLANQLIGNITDNITNFSHSQRPIMIDMQKDLLDVAGSTNPRVTLELCLYKHCFKFDKNHSLISPKEKPVVKPTKTSQPTETNLTEQAEEKEASTEQNIETLEDINKDTDVATKTQPISTDGIELNKVSKNFWLQFLDQAKNHNSSLYSLVRMAEPVYDGQKLILNFKFAFHAKKANDAKNKPIFIRIAQNILGDQVTVEVNFTDQKPNTKKNNDLQNVSNIFGSTEVLES